MSKAAFVRGANGRGVGLAAVVSPHGNLNTTQYRNIGGKMYRWDPMRHEWLPYTPPPAPRMAPMNPLQQAWKALFHGLPVAKPGQFQFRQIAATRSNFSPPAGLDSSTASSQLLSSMQDLLTAYSGGAPSEHAYDSKAAAFQAMWDAESAVIAAGSSASLDVDGGYGPNTHDAVAAINGGSAPSVNTAPAPAGSTPTTTVVPSSSNASVSMPNWGPYAIGAAAVGGAAIVGAAVIKKHGGTIKGHARRAHAHLRAHASRMHAHARRLAHR
jgi:hypothetical protein